jgi:hypothetical protein
MCQYYTRPRPYGRGYFPCDLYYGKSMTFRAQDAPWIKAASIGAVIITTTYTLANTVLVHISLVPGHSRRFCNIEKSREWSGDELVHIAQMLRFSGVFGS